jgi:predicted transcriptional regulator
MAWEQCGVTQREIAAACGVTPFAVSKMLRRAATLQATDRKVPPADRINPYCSPDPS